MGLGDGKGVGKWARGARGRRQVGSAGARAQPRRRAETGLGRAQSARRRAPRARAASRGAARVAQVEAGAGAAATPGLKFQPPGWALSTALSAGGPSGAELHTEEEGRGAGPRPPRARSPAFRGRPDSRSCALGAARGSGGAPAGRRGVVARARRGEARPRRGLEPGRARAAQPRWRRRTCKP